MAIRATRHPGVEGEVLCIPGVTSEFCHQQVAQPLLRLAPDSAALETATDLLQIGYNVYAFY
jgi:hypothetical protein